MLIKSIRLEESDQGTISVWLIDDKVFSFAIEPPDRDNLTDRSSIPPGFYTIKPYSSPRYPKAYQITDVPGRTKILIHAGNTIKDTLGCPCLGDTVGKLVGNRAVLNSGRTYKKFLALMGNESHQLMIMEVY